ncbi:MAG: DNA polymerase II [Verrucomicrobia bacterium 13_1_20CM_54_28]|nr:MAG: DNA polymerase II [Verrucomicrobia bacterium 13_1_20CM_54_28]OLE12928.1 MAG: DNA polymerase II [Verrucomicrobia bacterium 13_1_20CM_3_54_17]
MAKGQREALELAEAARDPLEDRGSFASNLFVGRYDFDRIYPYPAQSAEDRAAGEEFLQKLETYLRDHVDPDEIDRTGEIPPENFKGLAEIGAFGIKVPKKYGGLGLSQCNYGRAAVLLGSWDGNVAALVSAHQSIGVAQPLLLFGTEEQKQKYLPRVAGGEISAFALTETHAGSDPATMSLRAEPSSDGSEFVLNGEKLWCTNGVKAGVLVVMARTPSKMVGGKERKQITAFIVDVDTPGLEIIYRCRFMGLRALYNAVVKFTDVRVPRENIISKEGAGLKVALTTLNTGRLTLPAACVGLSKRLLEISRKWASERIQWGVPIGKHAAIAGKIAEMAGNVFAMEAMTFLTSSLLDRKAGDLRIETAMCKMWATETTWRIADDAMQVRGGRGYETAHSLAGRGEPPIAVERFLRDCRVNTIFEGSSEIMRLFIAREALDPHLKVGGAIFNTQLPMSERAKAVFSSGKFYAGWYPRQWLLNGAGKVNNLHPTLRGRVDYAARTSKRLARGLFHAMARFGPKLDREQLLLSRFVGIATELFAISATCSYAQWLLDQGRPADEILTVADYFCRSARMRIDHHFAGTMRNVDKRGYALVQDLLAGKHELLRDGIV